MPHRARRAVIVAIVTLLFLGVSALVAVWAKPSWVRAKIDLGLKLVGLQEYASEPAGETCYVAEPMCYEMPAPEHQGDSGEDEPAAGEGATPPPEPS